MSLHIEPITVTWKDVGFGEFADSDNFVFRNNTFSLRVQKGSDDDIQLVLLHLNLYNESDGTPFPVSVQVESSSGSTGQAAEQLRKRTDRVRIGLYMTGTTILWSCSTWEVRRLLPEYQSDGLLTFRVAFGEQGPDTGQNARPTACVQTSAIPWACLESLSHDFSKMLDAGSSPDVELRCEGLTTSAHKSVLCSRSPVLAKMLQTDMKEANTGVVNVKDMEADTFRLFLRYLYTARLDEELTTDRALNLYEAADMFAVHSLKRHCSDFLVTNLATGNACDVLVVADVHSDAGLVEAATGYILENRIPLSDETWSTFCEAHPKLANKVYGRFCKMLCK